jgi:aldehyde:ferredoxin oxidoreductase
LSQIKKLTLRPIDFSAAAPLPSIYSSLLQLHARREGLGDLLAEGTKRAAERLGRGSEAFAMHVKGEEIPIFPDQEENFINCRVGMRTVFPGKPY